MGVAARFDHQEAARRVANRPAGQSKLARCRELAPEFGVSAKTLYDAVYRLETGYCTYTPTYERTSKERLDLHEQRHRAAMRKLREQYLVHKAEIGRIRAERKRRVARATKD